jgi:hypothetical protein
MEKIPGFVLVNLLSAARWKIVFSGPHDELRGKVGLILLLIFEENIRKIRL